MVDVGGALEVGFQSPSWVDRAQTLVGRVPLPYLSVYTAVGLLGALAGHLLVWTYGVVRFPGLSMLGIIVGVWIAVPLAFIHFADELATRSLESFRPALGLPDQTFDALRTQLNTMPSRPLLLSNLAFASITFITNLLFPQVIDPFLTTERARLPFILLGSLAFGSVGGLIYHSTRQLRLIREIYERAEHLTIFRLEQTYAFSTISAATALVWAAFIYVTVATFPRLLTNPIYVSVTGLLALTILASVLSLLIGVNRKLKWEKGALRLEAIADLQTAFARLHTQFSSGEMSEMESLRHAIASMRDELELIEGLSTWPWQPGTIAAVLSALLLPAVVILIQELTLRLIG